MKKLLFKIRNKIGKLKIKKSYDKRPTSYPYISGDGFRKIADHLYDETQKCRPEKIKAGEIVFLKSDYLKEFFELVHPMINFRYKLVTHNGDKNITEAELMYIDEKVIHWFAQNVLAKHPKLTPIPIGLENKHYYYNGITRLFDKIRKQKEHKKTRILFGFSIHTNEQERQEAFDSLDKNKLAEKIKNFPLPNEYLSILNNYQFVASPPGNGLDCHRTWEALYLSVIPIVKLSTSTEYFKNLKLPIYTVDKWSDLDNITKSNLKIIYTKLISETNTKPLFMDYWIDLIKNKN